MTLAAVRKQLENWPRPDDRAIATAVARDKTLTKPQGSLGRLEELALWYIGWQRTTPLQEVRVLVFAGNHGVAQQGVSAYPVSVTAQMVDNFHAGGAAINQLAKSIGATLRVIPLSLDEPTGDFTEVAALSEEAFVAAFQAGANAVTGNESLLVVGEMGIGNTTVAAALAAAMFGGSGKDWVGTGTGVDCAGMARKVAAVDAALARHAGKTKADPIELMRRLGGRELAAIAGAVVAARQMRIPVVVDGFVATAAVAPLLFLEETALEHCQFAHVSAEAGHRRLLAAMGRRALLDLEMRLGEASGAALAVPILRAALAVHHGMATFEEAGVSNAIK